MNENVTGFPFPTAFLESSVCSAETYVNTNKRFLQIIEHLRRDIQGSPFENHVFAVGGAVRDFLSRRIVREIDLSVDIPDGGIRLARFLQTNKLLSHVVQYKNFGTAAGHYRGMRLEMVMTRSESYRERSRKPDVQSATLKEDTFRRDFTINSLYLNLSSNEILDLSGFGISDLHDGIIRTVSNPKRTFHEDPLRILRAIRFSARFGFQLESETKQGILDSRKRLEILSQSRVLDEIRTILRDGHLDRALDLLHEMNLLTHILTRLWDEKDDTVIRNCFPDILRFAHDPGLLESSLNQAPFLLPGLVLLNLKILPDPARNNCWPSHTRRIAKLVLVRTGIVKNVVNPDPWLIWLWLIKNAKKPDITGIRYLAWYNDPDDDTVSRLLTLCEKARVPELVDTVWLSSILQQWELACDLMRGKRFPLKGRDITQTFHCPNEMISTFLSRAILVWCEDPFCQKGEIMNKLHTENTC